MSFDLDAFNNEVFGFDGPESNQPRANNPNPFPNENQRGPESGQPPEYSTTPPKNEEENSDGVDKYFILKNIMKEKDRRFYIYARESEEPYLFVTNQVDQVLAGHTSYSQYPLEQISIPRSVTIFFMNVEHSYFGGIVRKTGPSISKDFFPEFVQRELELPNEIHLIRAFPIQWETKKFLGFHKVKDIRNPLNRNLETNEPQRINMAHECQEVAESAAMELKRAYDEWGVDDPPIYRPRPRFPAMMGRGMMMDMMGGHPMFPSMFPHQPGAMFPGQIHPGMMGPGFPVPMMGHGGGPWQMGGQVGELGGAHPIDAVAIKPIDHQEQIRKLAIQDFNKRSLEVQNTSTRPFKRGTTTQNETRGDSWDSANKGEREEPKPNGDNARRSTSKHEHRSPKGHGRHSSSHASKHSRFSSKEPASKRRKDYRKHSSSSESERSSRRRWKDKSRRNRSYSSSSYSSRSRSRDRQHKKRH